MSQDIRNYFKVTNSNTCGMLFKKTNLSKTIETPADVNEVINTQPTPTCNSEVITFEAFTDGSTLGNGGKNALGGIGVFFSR